MEEKSSKSEDKKKRIIEAALEEFALHGYVASSTNSITEKAGVSKGMLFHCFGSKKALYLHILNSAVQGLSEDVTATISKELDFFETLRKSSEEKVIYFASHPYEYKIICEAFYNTPKEVKEEIASLHCKISEAGHGIVIDKFNREKIREGVDRRKALELILMTFDFVEKKILSSMVTNGDHCLDDIGKLNSEMMEYVEILMSGIR